MQKRTRFIFHIGLMCAFCASATTVAAQMLSSQTKPEFLNNVTIEQNLNGQTPLDLDFVNEKGEKVKLQELFSDKPVVLSLVYYQCPMLCNMMLNGMLESFNELKFTTGDEFDAITVSFDHRETAEMAAQKKASYIEQYGRQGADKGWHFLTGDEESIKKLAEAVGFAFTFIPETGQFAHASAIILLTPQGRISRYFYGVEYDPTDLRLGLVEASQNKIGSPVDQLLLYCFHYDPTTGKYGMVIMNVIRVFGTATVALLISFIIIMLRREKRNKSQLART